MKWTDDDHTKAPYTKRSALDAAENYRWLANCFKGGRRHQWEAHLQKTFGGIDIRTPAYDINGDPIEGVEAVFVRKATDPATETD